MRFVRIHSSNNMPETGNENTKQTSNSKNKTFHFLADKSSSLMLNRLHNFTSTPKEMSVLLNKLKTEGNEKIMPQHNSSDPKPKKVSEIIEKYQELTKSQHKNEDPKLTLNTIKRSASLTGLNMPLMSPFRRFSTTADMKTALNFPSVTTDLGKVELIGSAFSPDQLMFSQSLQKSADKYGVVIGVRFPSEVGQLHLKEGHPTKNFHVKAKSSTTGPTAGFIAENPKYSKVGPEKWDKQQGYINDAISKGAKCIPLTLSLTQIENAINLGSMTKIGENQYVANYHGEEMHFIINPPDNRVTELNGDPIRVLTNPPESNGIPSMNKAITADYDLFSIVTKQNQSVNPRQLEVRHNMRLNNNREKQIGASENLKEYVKSGGSDAFHQAVNTFTQPKVINGTQDPDKGNTHFYGDVISNDINKNVAAEGFTGGKLVWHGDETGNPFSPGFDIADKPVFFIPGQPPQQISSMKELLAFYKELKRHGYSPESSPRLGI